MFLFSFLLDTVGSDIKIFKFGNFKKHIHSRSVSNPANP